MALKCYLIASSFISLAFSFIPLSAYQVIVLKVADGVKELPDNYDSKLKAVSDAKKENVNFYIAAEIENDPLLSKPQKFTVGDGHKTKEFVNEELEKGENYIVYERALTKAEKVCKLLISKILLFFYNQNHLTISVVKRPAFSSEKII